MGRTMKRIRINKLYSNTDLFDEIVFHNGINLILGEKYDEETTKGRKTIGVGKSMSIEFIDFCLLCDFDKSRIAKIPKSVFKPEEQIVLDLCIGEESVQIVRSINEQDKPIIIRNGKKIRFEKLIDAKAYLTELIFDDLSTNEVPSFRSLLSILIRDERSEFSDILKCHDIKQRIPDDFATHIFLLGLSLNNYRKVSSTIKSIESTRKELAKAKSRLTQNGASKLPEIKARMNALESEVKCLEISLDAYKSNEAFSSHEKELVELETILDQYRRKRTLLRRELSSIKELPQPEQVDDTEIELVYNQFKSDLGEAIVKSLTEVISFKNKVEAFQRVLINQKALELEASIEEISSQIRELDDKHSEIMRIIDTKGVLKDFRASYKIYEAKKTESTDMQYVFKQYEELDKKKKRLDIQKKQELLAIDENIDSLSKELKSFMNTIMDIHESIMGNKECSFDIKTNNSIKSKTPLSMEMRIFDDGSHSVNRTKVFIYDMALMFNEYTRNRHLLFLIHDNIFDVDQDTLVQCLNYLTKQEDLFSDFQYILTLNRDKIENEEKLKLIELDIDSHTVASFTKQKKFLKCDYQEI